MATDRDMAAYTSEAFVPIVDCEPDPVGLLSIDDGARCAASARKRKASIESSPRRPVAAWMTGPGVGDTDVKRTVEPVLMTAPEGRRARVRSPRQVNRVRVGRRRVRHRQAQLSRDGPAFQI
jgi:hypothetical protein